MLPLFKATQQSLQDLFAQIPNANQFLFIDPAQFEQINAHYIEFFKPMQIMLLTDEIQTRKILPNSHVVFLSRNDQIYQIINAICQIRKSQPMTQFHLLMSPFLTSFSDSLLRKYQVIDYIQTFENVNFSFSQSYDSACLLYSDLAIEQQLSQGSLQKLQFVAEDLLYLLKTTGGFERMTARGDLSVKVLSIYSRIQQEQQVSFAQTTYKHVIVLDRLSDLTTILLPGQTYADQLAQFLKISSNKCQGAAIYDQIDPIIAECKYTNIVQLGDKIANLLKEAKKEADNCRELQKDKSKSIQAISKAFDRYKQAEKVAAFIETNTQRVKAIQEGRNGEYNEIQMLKKQIVLEKSRNVLDYIQQLVLTGVGLVQAMELICLVSAACGGLRLKELNNIRKFIIQAFGTAGETAFAKCEQLQMITSNDKFQVYEYMSKEFKLVEEKEFDQINTSKPGYCFEGICPLTAALLLNELPDPNDKKRKEKKLPENSSISKTMTLQTDEKTEFGRTLLYFIGPLTHSELGSFDCVEQIVKKYYNDFELTVICSALKTGDEIFEDMLEIK